MGPGRQEPWPGVRCCHNGGNRELELEIGYSGGDARDSGLARMDCVGDLDDTLMGDPKP